MSITSHVLAHRLHQSEKMSRLAERCVLARDGNRIKLDTELPGKLLIGWTSQGTQTYSSSSEDPDQWSSRPARGNLRQVTLHPFCCALAVRGRTVSLT